MTASLTVLHTGYVGPEDDSGLHVGSTITLVSQGDTHVIVDPGLVVSTALILDPLRAMGLEPEQITDVVFSHQHIDHTLNAALFPAARFHDFAAVYQGDVWRDDDAEGRALADDIRLIRTPGHTVEDISTVVRTADGLIVCTHAWWDESGPDEDPYAPDPLVLRASRDRILGLEPILVIPGHGAPFAPSIG
jgi:glyoxylase-like metal-dependent hydrolase (beta-lactamase superfamily II)